jgi:SprB repeat
MTPTPTATPTTTPIFCGSGVTTGTYYYTDCCGNFITGNEVGLIVSLNYSMPSNGVTKLFVVAGTSCPTPTPTKTPTNTPTYSATPTVTPTITATPKETPTPSITPSNSPFYKLVNDCEIFTLFPLGVECFVVKNPSSAISTDGILGLTITGGTAPYSIYWSNGSSSKTQFNLKEGNYPVTVVDYWSDYTATTVCSLIAPTSTPTPSVTPTYTPTASPVYPQLCMLILNVSPTSSIQFVPNGTVNGKPSWISGTYVMMWNITNLRWEVQGLSLYGGILVSNSSDNIPISSWSLVGGTANPTINIIQGTCPVYPPFSASISKSDTDCTNSGSIIVNASGGVGPYIYSINGGVSYVQSPIFNSLSPQTYDVIVRDTIGNVYQQSVTVNLVGATQTYNISIYNYNLVAISPTSKKAWWVVNVTPSIPIGTTLNFVLNVDSMQYVSQPGSGVTSSTSIVYVDGLAVSPNSVDISNSLQIRPDCAPYIESVTSTNQNYLISMTSGTIVSGTTLSTLTITSGATGDNGCVTTLTQDTRVFASEGTTSGCNCCLVVSDTQSSGGIIGQTTSFGQAENVQIYYPITLIVPSFFGCATTPEIVYLMNSPVFAVGIRLFTGSPRNPQVVTDVSYVIYNQEIFEVDINGFITASTGIFC